MKIDEEHDTKSVSIKANYPFGSVDIETVDVQPLNLVGLTQEPKTKSSAPTKAIKTTVVSEVAVIGNLYKANFDCFFFHFQSQFDVCRNCFG